jgi:hypothetical protein
MSFHDFDFSDFWEKSDYATKEYVGEPFSPKLLEKTEAILGYKLPASYIELIKSQNGGIPKNTNYPTKESTSWADDHVALTGIFGIDPKKTHSLIGVMGGELMKDEWEYPDIGIYICDCPSAGHDMIALDYRESGKEGEPKVVHVDQELDYKVTFLAKNFEEFIKDLVHDSVYEDGET